MHSCENDSTIDSLAYADHSPYCNEGASRGIDVTGHRGFEWKQRFVSAARAARTCAELKAFSGAIVAIR